MNHKFSSAFIIVVWLSACGINAWGQEAVSEPVVDAGQEAAAEDAADAEEESAAIPAEVADIEAAIASYAAAFNARDIDKLVAHWSPDGVYTSPKTGVQSVGREAMAEGFQGNLCRRQRAPVGCRHGFDRIHLAECCLGTRHRDGHLFGR